MQYHYTQRHDPHNEGAEHEAEQLAAIAEFDSRPFEEQQHIEARLTAELAACAKRRAAAPPQPTPAPMFSQQEMAEARQRHIACMAALPHTPDRAWTADMTELNRRIHAEEARASAAFWQKYGDR